MRNSFGMRSLKRVSKKDYACWNNWCLLIWEKFLVKLQFKYSFFSKTSTMFIIGFCNRRNIYWIINCRMHWWIRQIYAKAQKILILIKIICKYWQSSFYWLLRYMNKLFLYWKRTKIVTVSLGCFSQWSLIPVLHFWPLLLNKKIEQRFFLFFDIVFFNSNTFFFAIQVYLKLTHIKLK